MTTRDYRMFQRDDGQLNVRLVPRAVYVQMLNRFKLQEAAIDTVFEALRWRWDLDKRAKDAATAGRDVSRAELAAEIMGEMEDRDWWKITAAFEEHMIEQFVDDFGQWSDLLDPVYDWQLSEGWEDRHYAPYPAAVAPENGSGT